MVLISAQEVQSLLELAWRFCCKLYSNSEAKSASGPNMHTHWSTCVPGCLLHPLSLGLSEVQAAVCGCCWVFTSTSTCFVQTETVQQLLVNDHHHHHSEDDFGKLIHLEAVQHGEFDKV